MPVLLKCLPLIYFKVLFTFDASVLYFAQFSQNNCFCYLKQLFSLLLFFFLILFYYLFIEQLFSKIRINYMTYTTCMCEDYMKIYYLLYKDYKISLSFIHKLVYNTFFFFVYLTFCFMVL